MYIYVCKNLNALTCASEKDIYFRYIYVYIYIYTRTPAVESTSAK